MNKVNKKELVTIKSAL